VAREVLFTSAGVAAVLALAGVVVIVAGMVIPRTGGGRGRASDLPRRQTQRDVLESWEDA
jgi:hypothetical protein